MSVVAMVSLVCLLHGSMSAQGERLWVMRSPGEMAEFDPATFTAKQIVKIPPPAMFAPQSFSVNHLGQMLFVPELSMPLAEEDVASGRKAWLWDGHNATIVRDVARSTATAGSNLAITESIPQPFLSEDGAHLYWFSNQSRRLQRDGVDLSVKIDWLSWKTDLAGGARQDVASITLPDCACPTGACEESCPHVEAWVPQSGVGHYFLLTQSVAGTTQPMYKSSSLYEEGAGKWSARPIDPPLRHVLDSANGDAILEAVPDNGCCGWQNQSNDQTLLHLPGRTLAVFDEMAAYKNPDYDVSFFTANGKLSPDLGSVAITIAATAQPNKPIQLSEQGQANPEESQNIRKALLDLPAVEVKSSGITSRRLTFVPHATLVGWIRDQEILILEGDVLVAYNVVSGARRKSTIRVDDAEHVFLR